jgi:hypothetical protein
VEKHAASPALGLRLGNTWEKDGTMDILGHARGQAKGQNA